MSRIARARQYSEYLVFRFVAALITALPLELASRWSGAGWRLVAPRLRRHQRALDNLARAFPETTPDERQQIALAMWDNLGRTFAEFFHIKRIVADGRIALEPIERFEAIAKSPFVVCTLHMGNWELVSQAALRFGLPPGRRLSAAHQSVCRRWLYKVRAPLYPGGLFDKSPRPPAPC